MLSFHLDAAKPRAMFDSIARRASAPAPILKRWGGYMRVKTLDRADAAEGWPGLAESTKEKLQASRTSKVTAWGGVRESYATKLESYLRVQGAKGSATAAADLAELRRLRAGGSVERDAKGKKAAAWNGSKAIDRLRRGLARAQDQRAKGRKATVGGNRRRGDNHKLLGSVARQIVWNVEGNRVTTMSRVPWSEVHNAGGAVGNGATVPAREFLYLEPGDLAEMNKIALQHMMGVGR